MNKQENINLTALQNFLDEKGIQIPIIKKNPKTFLGIAKQPHYENVLSNILAFYFDVTEEHGLDDLFISSFKEIITEKTKRIILLENDFDVYTEYTVKDKKRIDILLQNEEQAIIIENKVYHHLNNDLEIYWDSIKKTNKIGIVLSLKPYNTIHNINFINITHFEFLKKVMDNLSAYKEKASKKYLVFLKDLFQNIKNLSNKNMNEKEIKFYFNNQDQINTAKDLYFGTRNYIKQEVISAGLALKSEDFVLTSSKNHEKRLRYYRSKKNSQLMITVLFEDLLSKKKTLHIMVELRNELLINKEQYNLDFGVNSAVFNNNFKTNKNKNWAHFAHEQHDFQKLPNKIYNLQQFILSRIEKGQPLRIVFDKLNEIIPKR